MRVCDAKEGSAEADAIVRDESDAARDRAEAQIVAHSRLPQLGSCASWTCRTARIAEMKVDAFGCIQSVPCGCPRYFHSQSRSSSRLFAIGEDVLGPEVSSEKYFPDTTSTAMKDPPSTS